MPGVISTPGVSQRGDARGTERGGRSAADGARRTERGGRSAAELAKLCGASVQMTKINTYFETEAIKSTEMQENVSERNEKKSGCTE